MPEWHFFAFNSKAVSKALLIPAQEAVRNRDLPAWQQVYDKLNSYHYPPYTSGFSWEGTIIQNFEQNLRLSPDRMPDETDFVLRRCLQTFVELVSSNHLVSRCTRVRHWVLHEMPWKRILAENEEMAELELFNKEAWARKLQLPDPFWCLASNDAVDANYIDPEMVQRLAEEEARVGLFRRLANRTDLDVETRALAQDLAAAALLVELAANLDLALYFREDGT
jgi:hypothetical protein